MHKNPPKKHVFEQRIMTSSLHQYLHRRYLAILVLLIAAFVIVIFFMRYSSMDDTTEYYMFYEAEILSDYYQPSDDIIEFDLGRKEYFWGKESLPDNYKNLLLAAPEEINNVQLFELENQFVYILPFLNPQKTEVFFVVHIFDKEQEAMFYKLWQQLFFLVVLLILILVIYYSVKTNRKIIKQIDSFHLWMKTVTSLDFKQLQQQQLPTDLSFSELIESSQSLQASLLMQHQLQEHEQQLLAREQNFLSSLSHELRTPIATISAALSLLNKSNNLNNKELKVLEKLTKANRNMKQLTNTLLQLWRRQENTSQNYSQDKLFLLDELIEQAIAECQLQFSNHSFHFNIDVEDNIQLFSQYELVKIIISNLIRNACQYSSDGVINIRLQNLNLTISNTFNTAEHKHHQSINYGFGLGLYLVEKICQQQHWKIDIVSSDQTFNVAINLIDESQSVNSI